MKQLSTQAIQKISTPAGNPPAGFIYIYAKSDDKLYRKDSSGTETLIEGTGGGGSTLTTRKKLVTVDGTWNAVDNTYEYTPASDDYFLEWDFGSNVNFRINMDTITANRILIIKNKGSDYNGQIITIRQDLGGASYNYRDIYSGDICYIQHLTTGTTTGTWTAYNVLGNDGTNFARLFDLKENISGKNVPNGYAGLDGQSKVTSGLGFGMTVPEFTSINPTNPDSTSKGVYDWEQTVTLANLSNPFDSSDRVLVNVCFPNDEASAAENSPEMLDIISLSARVVPSTYDIIINASFREPTNGKIYLTAQIVGNVT